MFDRRTTFRPARTIATRQIILLEQAAQIIARMGPARLSSGREAWPDPQHRIPSSTDGVLQMFNLPDPQELLYAVEAVIDAAPRQRLEQRALRLADAIALYDGRRNPADWLTLRIRASYERHMMVLFAETFGAEGVAEPWLRALSLLTLLDRSPVWFRRMGAAARETYVRWAVANLLTTGFQ